MCETRRCAAEERPSARPRLRPRRARAGGTPSLHPLLLKRALLLVALSCNVVPGQVVGRPRWARRHAAPETTRGWRCDFAGGGVIWPHACLGKHGGAHSDVAVGMVANAGPWTSWWLWWWWRASPVSAVTAAAWPAAHGGARKTDSVAFWPSGRFWPPSFLARRAHWPSIASRRASHSTAATRWPALATRPASLAA